LPVISALGSRLEIIGLGSGGWKIAQNAGQSIQIGIVTSTVGVGGSVSSAAAFDSLSIVCVVANTKWAILGAPESAGLIIV
jgi:hypothetical protein